MPQEKSHESQGITAKIASVADGQVIPIAEVNDQVFAEKMMGDGFGVIPDSAAVYAPISGKVTNVFPTKHAIGLLSEEGVEVLIHMGLDTVELQGVPFTVKVTEGQQVTRGDLLAEMDIAAVKAAGKDTTIVVVMTNTEQIDSFELTKTGQQKGTTVVGIVKL
jgi:glucose-specific phosphotransferase system IIA component